MSEVWFWATVAIIPLLAVSLWKGNIELDSGPFWISIAIFVIECVALFFDFHWVMSIPLVIYWVGVIGLASFLFYLERKLARYESHPFWMGTRE